MADEHRDADDERAEPDPFPPRRHPPLHLAMPNGNDPARDVAIKAVDAIAQIGPRINELADDVYRGATAILVVESKVDRLAQKIDELAERLHKQHAQADWDRRRKLPSLSEYNPDYTPGGGIKLDPQEFAALSQRMAAYEAELEEAKQAADIAAAERRGAETARLEVEVAKKRAEEASAKFREKVLFWMKVVGFGGPPLIVALTYLITHFAKL